MYVVTGATGNVGRLVVDLLARSGAKVAGVSRDPAAALPDGVERLAPASWPAKGAEAVVVAPRAVGDSLPASLERAAAAGLRRVVLLSAVTVEYGGGYARFAAQFAAAEDAVRASGLDWTFLRCADFAANSLAWAPQIRATGTVAGAYGRAATSPVHERDIAEVAVRALLEPERHTGQAYALTGPQSLTQEERATQLGARFIEVPAERARAAMLAQGLPADVPDRLLGYLATCSDQPGPATDTVERLLGRARTFREWADEHAAAFAAGTGGEAR
ncbi:NAD(P)H-binding protein [Streptomyces sp. SID5785]|uniref:SDR family oxidoreductase n=1 Tax=Streptomyces sp. SID5785 TaxID=2690309 RepID=UPI0013612884|nr:NAD(P)H-binding protein [Streptomyces sp. SID5785]MZD07943.1 NAD(P)H-binding protein [Streptomyces sp. SID5785]